MKEEFQEEEINQIHQLLDGWNEIRTEICPLDLTTWKSLVILISALLMTQWEEDLIGVESREKGESMKINYIDSSLEEL